MTKNTKRARPIPTDAGHHYDKVVNQGRLMSLNSLKLVLERQISQRSSEIFPILAEAHRLLGIPLVEQANDQDGIDSIVSQQITQLKRRRISARRHSSAQDSHDEFCHVCKVDGELLCCDSCNLVFHLNCVRPRLHEIPPGKWNCAYCIFEGEEDQQSSNSTITKKAIVDMMVLAQLVAQVPSTGGSCSACLRFDKSLDTLSIAKNANRFQLKQQSVSANTTTSTDTATPLVTADNDKHNTIEEALYTAVQLQEQLLKVLKDSTVDDELPRKKKRRMTSGNASDDETTPLDDDDSTTTRISRNRQRRSSSTTSADVYDLTSSTSKKREERGKVDKGKVATDDAGGGELWCSYCLDDQVCELCVFCGCQVCFGKHNTDFLIICDGCEEEAHTYCLQPALTSIPKGSWYCQKCVSNGTGANEDVTDGKLNKSLSSGSSSMMINTDPHLQIASKHSSASLIGSGLTTPSKHLPFTSVASASKNTFSQSPVTSSSAAMSSMNSSAVWADDNLEYICKDNLSCENPFASGLPVKLPPGVLVTVTAVLDIISTKTKQVSQLPDYVEGKALVTSDFTAWNARELLLFSLFRQYGHASEIKLVLKALTEHRTLLARKHKPVTVAETAPAHHYGVAVKLEDSHGVAGTSTGLTAGGMNAGARTMANKSVAVKSKITAGYIPGNPSMSGHALAHAHAHPVPGYALPLSHTANATAAATGVAGGTVGNYNGSQYNPPLSGYAGTLSGRQVNGMMVLPSPPIPNNAANTIPSTINHKGSYYYNTQIPAQYQAGTGVNAAAVNVGTASNMLPSTYLLQSKTGVQYVSTAGTAVTNPQGVSEPNSSSSLSVSTRSPLVNSPLLTQYHSNSNSPAQPSSHHSTPNLKLPSIPSSIPLLLSSSLLTSNSGGYITNSSGESMKLSGIPPLSSHMSRSPSAASTGSNTTNTQ